MKGKKMKHELLVAGMAIVVSAGLLSSGCRSNKASTEPIYSVYAASDQIENTNKSECLRMFDGQKAKTSGMADMTVAGGVQMPPRMLGDVGEIYYVASGSGMWTVNGTAFIVRDGAGLYVPRHSRLVIYNNGKEPLKCLMIAKSLAWIGNSVLDQPMAFDKREPSYASKNYKDEVGTKPMAMGQQELKTTSLSPNEAKVNTLQEEGYGK